MNNLFPSDTSPLERRSADIFLWDDIGIMLQVLPGISLRLGACMRRSVWYRTKDPQLYQLSGLAKRRHDARKLMEDKDYRLLSSLQKACYEGLTLPDSADLTHSFGNYQVKLTLPLIRDVDGEPTGFLVRSLSSRQSCIDTIYGTKSKLAQPQARDLALAALLLYMIPFEAKPMRHISQIMLVYSDQAYQNTTLYRIHGSDTGPVVNGLVYAEITAKAVLDSLDELYNSIQQGDGRPDFLYINTDVQLAAAAANLISQKDVGWRPVAGWPCRSCGWASLCLPVGTVGFEPEH